MQSQHDMKQSLKHLSALLARIHKALMEHQMQQRERRTGETLNPATKLNLLLGDPEFAWLRTLSQLMVLIDDAYFQKEPLTESLITSLRNEVDKLLVQQTNEEFAKTFNSVAPLVPGLQKELGELRALFYN
ncbi:MAG TPA: hypothetical protein VFV50_10185 [Bdellovibrionales bacterium]|nr:hypothetical protein [Bdellovibrionales bacterium]